MAIGFVRSRRYPVILLEDKERPAADQTTFFIRPITAALRSEFDDATQAAPDREKEYGKWMNRILRDCLVGWENLKDENGQAIAFEAGPDGGASEKSLDCLLANHRYELGGLALSGSYLGEKEKKT